MTDKTKTPDQLRMGKVDEMLQWLDMHLEEVRDLLKDKRGILTPEQIDFLRIFAEKNINGMSLIPNQREMKSQIHQKVGYALRDIRLLIKCGFIGARSEWDPGGFIHDHVNARLKDKKAQSRPKQTLPYSINTWKEDVSVGTLADIVRTFVEMFGDEYAVPLARSIELGLQEREDVSRVKVEVPIIRRSDKDWRWD
jgi:hypothetical protein